MLKEIPTGYTVLRQFTKGPITVAILHGVGRRSWQVITENTETNGRHIAGMACEGDAWDRYETLERRKLREWIDVKKVATPFDRNLVEDFCIRIDGEEIQCNRDFQCPDCGQHVEGETPTIAAPRVWRRECSGCDFQAIVVPFTEEAAR